MLRKHVDVAAVARGLEPAALMVQLQIRDSVSSVVVDEPARLEELRVGPGRVLVTRVVQGPGVLRKAAIADLDDPATARAAETAERALLYVALTRARKSAIVTANGTLSPFLKLAATGQAA